MNQGPVAFFDSFADTFDTLYDGRRNAVMRWIDRRFRSDMFARYALTFERLGDLTGKRGLDVGCGSGPYVAESLRRGAGHVVALDPAPRMLELTEQRVRALGLSDRLTLVGGSFPESKPPGPFDFAIVMGVLDYVEDSVSFLGALRSLLAGKAVASFPSQHWFRTPLRRMRYRLRRCPLYIYREDQVRDVCRRAGFHRVEVVKIPGAGMDYHVCLTP
jgi:2-polyprenyl-3-methyl-5-hydroxy-6-metoxy-1,4-benzoquinol methylase